MNEHDDLIDRVVETLKEPVDVDPRLDARVMAEVAAVPPQAERLSRLRRTVEWLTRPRTVRLSPVGGLAMAAGVAALVLVGSRVLMPGTVPTISVPDAVADFRSVQFVLVQPGAESVAVVGDFNDWDLSATMLTQDQSPGVWSVTVQLEPGRYRYSFLVDGTTWVTDPRAAPAVADEFGRPNSVVTIGEL